MDLKDVLLSTFKGRIWVLNTLVTMAMAAGNSTKTPKDNSQFLTDEMVTGLCMGFGFIVGLITFICIIWCLCCGSGCRKSNEKKGRVGPSPSPGRTAPSTRSTTANTYSTGGRSQSRRS
ncbi:uncharacterized protein LOC117324244 [Pecten maximus]|uniref:uncharacterized protein LOC117324244 n=1 Tax=Pecten maximus TaxID=6579 RepID=UPI001458CD63|nr:uncharacterized protein LOC117324244 [Pecten maximus]